MYQGPPIVNRIEPTAEEIRAWAYSDALAPMEDWDIIIAELGNLPILLDLVGDPGCRSRSFLLSSLYCLVGHSDRSDARLRDAVVAAERTNEPWLTTWAQRVRQIVDRPESFDRDDWCGWPGYSTRPTG